MQISIVIPCHNEAESLPAFHARLAAMADARDEQFGFVYVDDGSSDATAEVIEGFIKTDPRVELLALSRNFGHEAASTAGLDYASGDAVVLIDADGQDPPEVIPALIEQFHVGYDVVAARRSNATGEGWFKPLSSHLFYRVLRVCSDVNIPAEVGDFRLMSRQAVDALCQCREPLRFVRGLSAWVGYRQTTVDFERAPREAGKSNYSIFKLFRLATDAILGFSDVPLRLCLAMTSLVGLTFVLALLVKCFGGSTDGCPFYQCLTHPALVGAVAFLSLTMIGLYVGKIYRQGQRRPLYLLDHRRSRLREATLNCCQGEFHESDA